MKAVVKKPSDLRKELFDALDESAQGRKLFVIPHKGGDSVLIGKEALDELNEQLEIQKDINQSLLDAVEGRVSTLAEVDKRFEAKFRKWRKR